MFHEFGHLQDSGDSGEVLPELNELEQTVMGHAVFSGQGRDMDTIRWAYQAYLWTHQYLYLIHVIREGGFSDETLNPYNSADVFVASQLIANQGDFASLRQTIRNSTPDALDFMVAMSVTELISEYSAASYDDEYPTADASLRLEMAIFRELYLRFGYDTAIVISSRRSLILSKEPSKAQA